MKSYRSASISDDGSLIPPCFELSFNASIQSNDGLVAHSIMKRSGVTFEEARIMLSNGIEDIKNHLKADREFTFGRVGTLALGADDNICFTPFNSPTSRIFKTLRKLELEDNSSARAADLLNKDQDLIGNKYFDTNRNYYIPINKRFARIAAAILLVVAAASTFVVPSLRNIDYSAYQRASVVPIEWNRSNSSDNLSIENKVESQDISNESDYIGQMSEPQQEIKESSHLIVAVFNNIKDAEKFIASQPEEFSRSMKIHEGKKLIKVSAASSDDRAELVALMHDSDFKSRYQQSWIMDSK